MESLRCFVLTTSLFHTRVPSVVNFICSPTMNFTVTVLGLGPIVEALHALAAALRPSDAVLRAGNAAMDRIPPLDNPEAGGAPAPVLAAALPQPPAPPMALMQPAVNEPALPAFAVGFVPPGGAVAQVPPPPFTPAPSTAAVAAPLTAPAVPSLTAPPVPPAPAAAPAPTAAAPAAPVPPPVSAPGAVQLDSRGLPWDHRIHSSPSKAGDPKPMNKDGSWRQKRGTADTYVKDVEALLRAAMAANGATAAPAAPAAPPVPAAPAAVQTAPPPPPAAPVAGINFGQLATKLEPHFVSARLTWDAVNPILARFGLQQFNQLMHAPAVIPLVDAEISTLLGLAPGVAA